MLPARKGAAAPLAVPTVAIDVGALYVDGRPADRAEVLDVIGARAAWWRASGMAAPPWMLAVDAEAPWGEVAPLVSEAAAAGYPDVVVVFGRAVDVPAPPPSAITPELQRIAALPDASERPVALVGAVQAVFGSCKPVMRAFGEAAGVAPDERSAWLAHRVAQGVGACGCTGDMASIRSLGWTLWGPGGGAPVTAAPVRFSAAGEAVEVALPAATPWAEAAAALVGAAGPVRAVAK